jgi:hypothetical protein
VFCLLLLLFLLRLFLLLFLFLFLLLLLLLLSPLLSLRDVRVRTWQRDCSDSAQMNPLRGSFCDSFCDRVMASQEKRELQLELALIQKERAAAAAAPS